MSLFDLSDFERQGNVEQDAHVNRLDDALELLNQLSADALRTIQIYTPDLEPVIYSNQQLIDNILNLSRGNRHAKVQILAIDTKAAIHRGHLLLGLAHKLTSVIDIRTPSEEYQEDNFSFILVDNKGFLYRPDTGHSEFIYNPGCKTRGQKLSEIFTMTWEHSDIDLEARRLNI